MAGECTEWGLDGIYGRSSSSLQFDPLATERVLPLVLFYRICFLVQQNVLIFRQVNCTKKSSIKTFQNVAINNSFLIIMLLVESKMIFKGF